jgi:Helix-turn-helix.
MVGQRIKAYLTENGIKQTFLSDKTDIPNPILSAMLSGQRKIEVMEYYRICLALKVDFLTFLTDGESEI